MLAQEAARTHKHAFIGTEHMMLGVLGETRGLAYDVLVAKAGSEQHVRDAVRDVMPPAGEKDAARAHRVPAGEQGRHRAGAAMSVDRPRPRLGRCRSPLLLRAGPRVEDSPAAQILRSLGFTSESLHETSEGGDRRKRAGRVSKAWQTESGDLDSDVGAECTWPRPTGAQAFPIVEGRGYRACSRS
ncbi:Clp protease N-terminal domain-containing protein [Yinghuangia aomiensis]